MDWYAWLLKTGLEPTLAYDFGLVFSNNDLDEDDIPFFDHAFLVSMGISVAKHRLEILKLAKIERRQQRSPRPMTSLLVAADRTRKRLTGCLSRPAGGGDGTDSPELTTAPWRTPLGGVQHRSRVSLKREKKLDQLLKHGGATRTLASNSQLLKHGSPMLANNSVRMAGLPPPEVSPRSHVTSPTVYSRGTSATGSSDGKSSWGSGGGEAELMRWDSMFQDLKPT